MSAATFATILGALIAALGYVGNLVVTTWLQRRRDLRERDAQLVQLQSYLLASKQIFFLQSDLSNRLYKEYLEKDPSLKDQPYDEVFAHCYASANDRQKLLHGLIRQYTISAVRPLNQKMLDWLARDSYYKLASHTGVSKKLALALRTLDAHLILWMAKFDYWIPDRPERVLVFMADENEHGIGFPLGIDDLVASLAGGIRPRE